MPMGEDCRAALPPPARTGNRSQFGFAPGTGFLQELTFSKFMSSWRAFRIRVSSMIGFCCSIESLSCATIPENHQP